MKFDPGMYSISIRKEDVEGEMLYIGRVAEFPNISAFEATYDDALAILRDAICAIKEIADERGVSLPAPLPSPSDQFSGRVTLRLPKTLHAKVDRLATQEGVSVNQFLNTAIAVYVGEINGFETATATATRVINGVLTSAFRVIDYLRADPRIPREEYTTKGAPIVQKEKILIADKSFSTNTWNASITAPIGAHSHG